MRGEYRTTHDDRIQFWIALHELCELKDDFVKLSGTHLNLSNCQDLLEELGYELTNSDIGDWEMDFWWDFECEGLPDISVSGCGYTAGLNIRFTVLDMDEPIYIEKFIKRVQEKWGKFFPTW